MLVKVGHQDGRSLRFLLKMFNTRSPITLERNALAQNLVQVCSFKFSTILESFCYVNLLFNASGF